MTEDTQWLILRLFSIVYFTAYFSLKNQIIALYGKRGLIPSKYSDTALKAGIWIGLLSSIGAFIGYYPTPFLIICWIIYQLYCRISKSFLQGYWDFMLQEAGLFFILYSVISPPPYFVVLLIKFFIFRVILGAGIQKILHPQSSNEWRSLSFLYYFFQIQPLPNRLAYYCHQAPHWLLRFLTAGVIAVFFIAPMLMFTSYSYVAFFAVALVQLSIWATSNFPWFNPLTIIVALILVDVPPIFPHGVTFQPTPTLEFLLNGLAILLLVLNVIALLVSTTPWLEAKFQSLLGHWNLAKPYPLFRRIVDYYRKELLIEGSYDGLNWRRYEFRYNAWDIFRPPAQASPHYPRIEWRVWELRMCNFGYSQLFLVPLFGCLLEGVPEVIQLFKNNPFPDAPPKYIKATVYPYRFSDLALKRRTGQWWIRGVPESTTPIYTLEEELSPRRKKANRRPKRLLESP